MLLRAVFLVPLCWVILSGSPDAGLAGFQDDAKQIYEAMHSKLCKAKTLRLTFELAIRIPEEFESRVSGKLFYMQEGHFRLVAEGEQILKDKKAKTERKEKIKHDWIADGKTLRVSKTIGDKAESIRFVVPAWQDRYACSMVGITGVEIGLMTWGWALDPTKAEEIKRWPIAGTTSITLGKKEVVTKKETQVLELNLNTLMPGVARADYDASVWVDTQSQLPVKLVLVSPAKSQRNAFSVPTTFTETYSDIGINAEVDPKTFEIPK